MTVHTSNLQGSLPCSKGIITNRLLGVARRHGMPEPDPADFAAGVLLELRVEVCEELILILEEDAPRRVEGLCCLLGEGDPLSRGQGASLMQPEQL